MKTPLAEIEFNGPEASVVQMILTNAARAFSFVDCVAGGEVGTGGTFRSTNASAMDLIAGGGVALAAGVVVGVSFFSGGFCTGFVSAAGVDVASLLVVCGVSSTAGCVSVGAITTVG